MRTKTKYQRNGSRGWYVMESGCDDCGMNLEERPTGILLIKLFYQRVPENIFEQFCKECFHQIKTVVQYASVMLLQQIIVCIALS